MEETLHKGNQKISQTKRTTNKDLGTVKTETFTRHQDEDYWTETVETKNADGSYTFREYDTEKNQISEIEADGKGYEKHTLKRMKTDGSGQEETLSVQESSRTKEQEREHIKKEAQEKADQTLKQQEDYNYEATEGNIEVDLLD